MHIKCTLILLLTTFLLSAQNTPAVLNPYFQQENNYEINVTLNDTDHILTGEVQIEYVNNAPVTLSEIYFHLWGNAFKNTETAFAQQKKRQGSGKFWFADADTYGSFTDIDFKSRRGNLAWKLSAEHPDIAVVTLDKPLKTGDRTNLSIPFTLKIPDSYSRLGHVGQSYQMTQWYPKPAVYDKNGWQAMPYLDQGEFYSDFGRYEVTVTLPENYVVGATGTLKTKSEQAFLKEKIKETDAYFADYKMPATKSRSQLRKEQSERDTFPVSSTKMKTIRYSAQNVHDFAWFADKRFMVRKSAVQLPNGKPVDTYVMFTRVEEDLWKDAVDYVSRSVRFYSEHVGDYPYPQATAVQSALSAGGGMEYPMITVIGLSGDAKSLDDVITHEVGHNWFYGILATNERIHPWMDEGLNTYYEVRYMRQNYSGGRFAVDELGAPGFLVNNSPYEGEQLALQHQKCMHRAQAPDTHSDELTSLNYGIGAYSKPAIALRQLEMYLGTELFDRAMKTYYEEWKFKHPTPQDFIGVLERVTEKDLSWFLRGFMFGSGKQDYKIKKITENADTYTVRVKNVGEVNAPFPLNGMRDDTTAVVTEWYDGFAGEKDLEIAKGEYTKVLLDGEFVTLEHDHRDNMIKTGGSRIRPIDLQPFIGLENPRKVYTGIFPLLAANVYDGLILGIGLHNYRLPERKLTALLTPAFGIRDFERYKGLGHLSYRTGLGSEGPDWLEVGLSTQHFSYNETRDGDPLAYAKYMPYVKLRAENPVYNRYSTFELQAVNIRTEFLEFDDTGNPFSAEDNRTYYVGSYTYEYRNAINPFSLTLSWENGSRNVFGEDLNYNLPKAEIKYGYTYSNRKNIDFRLFAGMMLSDFGERGIPGYLNLTGQGYSAYNDYKFDEWYFGRNENTGISSQQIILRDGGFKVPLPATQANNGFTSNSLLVSLNLKADLPDAFPGNLPIKPYFDMAFVERNTGTEDKTFQEQFWWNGGFALELGEVFALYFPVVSSNNLKAFQTDDRAKYFNRVSFVLDLKKLNPRRVTDRVR